jgi:hypothetical protein
MEFERIEDPPLSDSGSDQICFLDGSRSGPSQGAKTWRYGLRKRQFRFSSESELALLREISVARPWEAQYGDVGSAWDAVSKNLRIAGHDVDGKRAKESFCVYCEGSSRPSPSQGCKEGVIHRRGKNDL